MPDPFITSIENARTYTVTGTDELLEKLEVFMNENSIAWDVVTDE